MATIWIIGRMVELPNGHKYMAEPFIAFETNEDAQAACDMIEKVSGDRPGITDGALYRHGETMPRKQPATPEPQKPSRRADWHYDSQGYCDNPGRGY